MKKKPIDILDIRQALKDDLLLTYVRYYKTKGIYRVFLQDGITGEVIQLMEFKGENDEN